ncbi:MAG: AMP-binding protein, partial [Cyanobacteria bacterium J06643_5]
TGIPKGVMVSHGNLLHNLSLIHKCFGHSPQSKGVIWLPPYHDMGLIGGILQPLYGNFPVILMSPVDFLQKPIRWLRAISNYKATTSGGPNFAYDLCANKIKPEQIASLDLSSWEVAFTGAEPVRAHTLEKFNSTFESCGFRPEAFYPCYGMAENTLIVSGGLKSQPPITRFFDGISLSQNRVVPASKSSKDSQAIVG